jgi:hypothetical protein
MVKAHKEKKIDMAQHDYKIKSMGISDRAKKFFLRVIIFVIPALLFLYYIIKSLQQ